MGKPDIKYFSFGTGVSQLFSDEKKKIDEIILWDAYWEKRLEKNGTLQNTATKLRVLPHYVEGVNQTVDGVNLTLVFFFKYDTDEYDKNEAQFRLKIQAPQTIYGQKEYRITGEQMLSNKNFIKKSIFGVTFYFLTIKNFSFFPEKTNTK